MISIFVFK